MENIDSKYVKDVWKKKGSKLKAPKIFFAVYSSKVYYVYRDDSFIIFMIPSNCDVTYTLIKSVQLKMPLWFRVSVERMNMKN